ncbi:MAG: hypothetical protein AB8B86_12350 [Pseudomonadales bacterium]
MNLLETADNVLLTVHIVAGIISLALFWVPVLSRKGGVNHRRYGVIYVKLMSAVVISAAVMSVLNVIAGEISRAIFLGFLALLTAKPLWLGIEVLATKKQTSAAYKRKSIALNGLLSVSGFALIIYGITLLGEDVAFLMLAFGGLGLLGVPELIGLTREQVANADRPKAWLASHIRDMIISGIAAYTAFLAFGANELTSGLFTGALVMVPWLAPTVTGSLGIAYATIRFTRV